MTVSHSSFTHKQLRATFKLGQGDFGESGFDTIAFSGLRMSADIHEANNHQLSAMLLRIWGLTFDHMQKLSVLKRPAFTGSSKNLIMLEAGDSETGLHHVYSGDINLAWADYQHQPDVYFIVQSIGLQHAAIKPLPPVSYRGATDVSQIMEGIAKSADCQFTNHGVDVKLDSPYFAGTAREQLRECADAAGIEWTYDRGEIAIWPSNKARGDGVAILTPSTGNIGYVAFTEFGITLQCLYDPAIKIGGWVEIRESDIPNVNGKWRVSELAYNLESEMPGGNWMMTIQAWNTASNR